jgi:hypothetical protein
VAVNSLQQVAGHLPNSVTHLSISGSASFKLRPVDKGLFAWMSSVRPPSLPNSSVTHLVIIYFLLSVLIYIIQWLPHIFNEPIGKKNLPESLTHVSVSFSPYAMTFVLILSIYDLDTCSM